MVENLKSTRYSNGDLIGTTNSATLNISGVATPKYQWAYDGDESNVAAYGRLYTWYAVTDSRNVCPTGWHVPTDAEWTTLTTFLGGESVAGDKLKETGAAHWQSPNTAATNESGFTALPSGYRTDDGSFGGVGRYCYMWSSTTHIQYPSYSYYRYMFYDYSDVLNSFYHKWCGFSVRCIKD
jgi:uncharacterized protein (TIGR02145 family)